MLHKDFDLRYHWTCRLLTCFLLNTIGVYTDMRLIRRQERIESILQVYCSFSEVLHILAESDLKRNQYCILLRFRGNTNEFKPRRLLLTLQSKICIFLIVLPSSWRRESWISCREISLSVLDLGNQSQTFSVVAKWIRVYQANIPLLDPWRLWLDTELSQMHSWYGVSIN